MAPTARALTDLSALIERLTARVDQMAEDTRERLDLHAQDTRERFDKLESRISSLEKTDARESGRREIAEKIGAVALVLAGSVGTFILTNFSHILAWFNPPPPTGHN